MNSTSRSRYSQFLPPSVALAAWESDYLLLDVRVCPFSCGWVFVWLGVRVGVAWACSEANFAFRARERQRHVIFIIFRSVGFGRRRIDAQVLLAEKET